MFKDDYNLKRSDSGDTINNGISKIGIFCLNKRRCVEVALLKMFVST